MTGTLLTTVEVAERLGLSSAAVAQAVRSGALQPAARTSDDFLFTERAIFAYAERRAEATAGPPKPPPEGSRAEWAGELDRLNLWLDDLTAAARSAPPAVAPAEPAALPEVANATEVAQSALDPLPQPEAAAEHFPEPQPEAVAEPIREVPPIAEAVAEPVPEVPPVPEAVAEPLPEVPPAPDPVQQALPAPAAKTAGRLSRQAILVVEPIDRFRRLREVSELLGGVPGLAEARLESLENGLASYRLSFGSERPGAEALAAVLAPLGLRVILVDSEP